MGRFYLLCQNYLHINIHEFLSFCLVLARLKLSCKNSQHNSHTSASFLFFSNSHVGIFTHSSFCSQCVVQVVRIDMVSCFHIYYYGLWFLHKTKYTRIINKKQFNFQHLFFRIYALQKLLYFVEL